MILFFHQLHQIGFSLEDLCLSARYLLVPDFHLLQLLLFHLCAHFGQRLIDIVE